MEGGTARGGWRRRRRRRARAQVAALRGERAQLVEDVDHVGLQRDRHGARRALVGALEPEAQPDLGEPGLECLAHAARPEQKRLVVAALRRVHLAKPAAALQLRLIDAGHGQRVELAFHRLGLRVVGAGRLVAAARLRRRRVPFGDRAFGPLARRALGRLRCGLRCGRGGGTLGAGHRCGRRWPDRDHFGGRCARLGRRSSLLLAAAGHLLHRSNHVLLREDRDQALVERLLLDPARLVPGVELTEARPDRRVERAQLGILAQRRDNLSDRRCLLVGHRRSELGRSLSLDLSLSRLSLPSPLYAGARCPRPAPSPRRVRGDWPTLTDGGHSHL